MYIADDESLKAHLRQQVEKNAIRITIHAHQEMVEDNISYDEICEVLLDATLVENYEEHRRGPCCLVSGRTSRGRYVHVVCTTSLEIAVIITVYEPKPPKWPTPFKRGALK